MNYHCHKIAGATVATITAIHVYQNGILDTYSYHIENIPLKFPQQPYIIPLFLLFIFSLYAATIPDIDHPLSIPGKRHPHISQYINSKYGHRGITHYPLTLLAISILFYCVWKIIIPPYQDLWMWGVIGFIVGYASHIFLDTFNIAGVALLEPFSKLKIKIPSGIKIKRKKGRVKVCWKYLKSGKITDEFIVLIILLIIVFCYLRVNHINLFNMI